jgi:hypothetical protein
MMKNKSIRQISLYDSINTIIPCSLLNKHIFTVPSLVLPNENEIFYLKNTHKVITWLQENDFPLYFMAIPFSNIAAFQLCNILKQKDTKDLLITRDELIKNTTSSFFFRKISWRHSSFYLQVPTNFDFCFTANPIFATKEFCGNPIFPVRNASTSSENK